VVKFASASTVATGSIYDNGSIGIGTTSPTSKLHITQTSAANALLLDSDSTSIYSTLEWKVNGGNLLAQAFSDSSDASLYVRTVSSGSLKFGTNATERMRITSGGNVGIGTTSTAQKLHIVGSTLITNANYHYGYTLVGAQASLIGISASDNISVGQDNVNHANTIIYGGLGVIDLSTSGSTRMRVGYNGDVGIGTTTPDIFGRFYTRTIGFNSADSTVMQINGTSYGGIDIGAAGTRTFGITASGTEAQITTVTNIPLLFNINSVTKMTLNSTGLGIGTATPADYLEVVGSGATGVRVSRAGLPTQYATLSAGATGPTLDASSALGSLSFGLAGSTAMTLNSTGLGIGTSSPATKLHVYSAGGGFEFGVGSSNCYIETIDRANTATAINTNYYTRGTGSFTWNNGSYTERMRIDGSGNVGIGTTVPVAKLQVAGAGIFASELLHNSSDQIGWVNAKFTDYNDGHGIYISSLQAGGGKWLSGEGRYWNSGLWRSTSTTSTAISLDSGVLKFYTNSGLTANSGFSPSERMRITSDGNVGIGTTSPAQKLHVVGAVYGTTNGQFGNAVITGTGTGFAVFGSNAGGTGVKINLDSDITRNDLVISASSAYVGIGTASPGAKLDVVGDLRVKSAGAAITLDTSTTSDGRMEYKYNGTRKALIGVDSDNLQIAVDSGNYLQFRTNSTERMRITNDGYVGIGTSSPGSYLHIYAQSGATGEIRLQSSNGRTYAVGSTGTAYGSANNFIIYDITGAAERLRIQSDGNVGIGLTSPSYNLSISGSVGLQGNEEYLYFHSI